MTPRELSITMSAEVERRFDVLENEAFIAIMHEKAHRDKKPKASDLFKRPIDGHTAEKKVESLMERAENATNWLAQFEQFRQLSGEEEQSGE